MPTAVPNAPENTTASPATISDARAPKTSRLRTSRPRPSVPSQYVPPGACVAGGRRRMMRSCAKGLWGARYGAPRAAISADARIAAPRVPLGIRGRPPRRADGRVPAAAATGLRGRVAELDARVDDAVEHVRHHAGQHEHGRAEEHDGLHDRVVARLDCLQRQ